MFNINRFIRFARGEMPADLLLRNAELINVFTAETYPADVAIADGYVVGFGQYKARRVIDLKGLFLAPGFIDGHIHIESSMLSPVEFARAVLSRGTTAVVCDPHEIANVAGLKGIEFILQANKHSPLTAYVMLPSCVPATHLETSGASLPARLLNRLKQRPYVIGLAEMMNYPGVIYRDKEVIRKLEAFRGRLIDGHCPRLSGKDLSAYAGAGIRSDHESTSFDEAQEKLRNGMHLMIREGTAAKNLAALLPLVNPNNSRRCMLVSDDRHPLDILKEGHLDHILRKAVQLGLDPVTAVQMVTINPAEYFGLTRLGAIAPGYQADLTAFSGIRDFNVRMVFKQGKLIDPATIKSKATANPLGNTVKIANLSPDKLKARARGCNINVMEIVPHQIITRRLIRPALVKGGLAIADTRRDILKIAVVERHRASGRIGLGFVKGFGLKHGAIASSVAHDSHNIIVIGANDADMLTAVKAIEKMQGGQSVVSDGRILAGLPLPIGGLMSDMPLLRLAPRITKLHQAARHIGCHLPDPFMTMSFLSLPVIPELKLTDKGLVDVNRFRIIGLFSN
jgi:adenine deaminase